MRNLKKRALSIVTAFSLCLTMFPFGESGRVLAAEPEMITGSCSHHPSHTADCGYHDEVPEIPCTHEHDETCYKVQPIMEQPEPETGEEETQTDENAEGTAEDSGLDTQETEPADTSDDDTSEETEQILDCRHAHDAACGYTAAVEGMPCTYVCEICPVQNLTVTDELPPAEELTAENTAETETQLPADETEAVPTDEEPAVPEDTEALNPEVSHEGTLTLDLSEILNEIANTPMLLEAAGEYYGDQIEGTTKDFYKQYRDFFTKIRDEGGGDAFLCIFALPNTVQDISMSAIYALIRDHPDLLHWIKGGVHFRWIDLGGDGYKYVYVYFDAMPEFVTGYGSYKSPNFDYPILDLNGPATGGEAYRQSALQTAAAIAAYANETFDTDYEKIQYFHEEICRLTDYDFDTYHSSTSHTQSHSMYRAFNGGKVVCAGYAKAFKYLCDLSEIRCILVDGHGRNNAGQYGEHMWNYVELFGNWYLVDATWNDGENTRNYFMIGSSSGYYKGRYNPDLTTGHPALCTEDYHFVPPNKAHVTVADSNADRLILNLAWEDPSKGVPSALDASDILITPEVKIKSVDMAADGTSVTIAFDGHPETGNYQVRIKNAEKFVYAVDTPDFYVPPTSTIVHVSIKEAKLGSNNVVLLLEPESDMFGMPELTSKIIRTNRGRINCITPSSDGREVTLTLSEMIRTDLDYIFYFTDSETFLFEPDSLKVRYKGLPQAVKPDITLEPIYETYGNNRRKVAVNVIITRSIYDRVGEEYVSIVYSINNGPEQVYHGPFIWEAQGNPGDSKTVQVTAYVRSNYPDQYRSSITTKKTDFIFVRREPTSTAVDVSVQRPASDQMLLTLVPQTASLGMPVITSSDLITDPELSVLKVTQSEGVVTVFFSDIPAPGDYTIRIRDTEKYKYQPVVFHVEPSEPVDPEPEKPGTDPSAGDNTGDSQTEGTDPSENKNPSGGDSSTPDDGNTSGDNGSSGNGSTSGGNGSSGSGSSSGNSGSSGNGSPSGNGSSSKGSSSGGNHDSGGSNTPAPGNPQPTPENTAGTASGETRRESNISSSSLRSIDTISRLPDAGSLAPLKPDQNGNVTVDEAFISSILAPSAQSSGSNSSSSSGLEVIVPVKPANHTAPSVTIDASVLELLARQNVQKLELQIDGVLSAAFDQHILKALQTAAKGADIRLHVEEINPVTLSQPVKTALGTYAIYHLTLVSVAGGTESPLAFPEGCKAMVSIPCKPMRDLDTEELNAFSVDQAGMMKWIKASGYDTKRKAVVFEITQSGVYGIGYQSTIPASEDVPSEPLPDALSEPTEIRKGVRKQYHPSRMKGSLSHQGQNRKSRRQGNSESLLPRNRHLAK